MRNAKKLIFFMLIALPLWVSCFCSCGGSSSPTTPVQLPTTVEYISRGYEAGDVIIAGSLNACVTASGETISKARSRDGVLGFVYESDVDSNCQFCIAMPSDTNYLVSFSTATQDVANFAVSALDLKVVPTLNLAGAASSGETRCDDSAETGDISIIDIGAVTIDETNSTADTELTADQFAQQVNMSVESLLAFVDEWFLARSPAGNDGDENGCLDYQASYVDSVPAMLSAKAGSLADCALSERMRTRGADDDYSGVDGDNSTDDDTISSEAFVPVLQFSDATASTAALILQAFGLLTEQEEEDAFIAKYLGRTDFKNYTMDVAYLYYFDPDNNGLGENNFLNESKEWLVQNSGTFIDADHIKNYGYILRYSSNHAFDPDNYNDDTCTSVEGEAFPCDDTLYIVADVDVPLVSGGALDAWTPSASNQLNSNSFEYTFLNPSHTNDGLDVPPEGNYYIITEETAQNSLSAANIGDFRHVKFSIGSAVEYQVQDVAMPLVAFNMSGDNIVSIDYKWVENGSGDDIITDCQFKDYMFMLNSQVVSATLSIRKNGGVRWVDGVRIMNDGVETTYRDASYNADECAKTLDCTLNASGSYTSDRTCWASGSLDLSSAGKAIDWEDVTFIEMSYTDTAYNSRKLGDIR